MKANINGKSYTVEKNFNMVVNYEFTRNGKTYLVDGEDVWEWADDMDSTDDMSELEIAVQFAIDVAATSEDGRFWWKVKGQ